MPITSYRPNFPGRLGIVPRLVRMNTTDTAAQVRTAGYLDPYVKSQGFSVLPTDIILVVCADSTFGCKAKFNGDSISLVNLP